ncbi:HEAT repeat domain-containing protein [Mastigocoleus testarum]|uniref:Phycocyanobilin lyase n=1 Tax=Mastigocoleus testarum BC008 TaxID=371196 RepID=A0A0V7ZXY8_9CYAN|nr:HEAT repeat domain-containing protein [Mastigocoleus testarum]KST69248.1 phycocyanobilin lyase [Mastigocoleus testarum BC008]KST69298.1 phycocyanobilin lyase [Mastigocoleus testarum BC008]
MSYSTEENSNSISATSETIQGESLTVEQAIANLKGSDLGLRFYAAWWLGRFRVNEGEAVTRLITALEDEDDRTPEGGYPLRRNAARALGKIGDEQAVNPLIESLKCSDFYVREAAAQSLEMLGDPNSVPPLVELLEKGLENSSTQENLHITDNLNAVIATPGSNPNPLESHNEFIKSPEKKLISEPDFKEPYDAIIEALGTLGATQKIPLIKPFLEHPIPRIQYATARAMYQLTGETSYGEILVRALEVDDLQLRRTALSDLGAIGYMGAAEAISETLAENSLKLISLKGLLEREIKENSTEKLSEDAIGVMNLMDSLL